MNTTNSPSHGELLIQYRYAIMADDTRKIQEIKNRILDRLAANNGPITREEIEQRGVASHHLITNYDGHDDGMMRVIDIISLGKEADIQDLFKHAISFQIQYGKWLNTCSGNDLENVLNMACIFIETEEFEEAGQESTDGANGLIFKVYVKLKAQEFYIYAARAKRLIEIDKASPYLHYWGFYRDFIRDRINDDIKNKLASPCYIRDLRL